jgi:AraC-like DNA-binding protein
MLRLEEAAEQLLLSPNQLRKRLYRAGTTYKALVLKTRMELARHYLLDTHLSVQEIAYLLDYSTPAPFSRAFKQYFGLAPEYYRQAEAS